QAQQVGAGGAVGGDRRIDAGAARQQQADLGQQPGGGGQVGTGPGQQPAGKLGNAQRALAQLVGLGADREHLARQYQLAQRVVAQAGDRGAQVADLATAGVIGRVRQP